MLDTTADIDHVPIFPPTPPGLGSRRRRWRHAVSIRLASSLRILGPRFPEAFGILTYHRVSPDVIRDDAMLNVHPDRFRRQIEGLLALDYLPWPLRCAIETHQAGEPIPRNVFIVVFDDGYHDIYRHAWPVLSQHKVPATVFLATAYLDSDAPFPFDDWPGDTASSRPLSSAECAEMQASGLIELGSHTHTHADFRGRVDDFKNDLEQSVDTLHNRFGVQSPTFSFPYGFAGPCLTEAAREAGVLCGLTAECELVTSAAEPLTWGRFGGTDFDTPRTLAAKLDGWYSFYREAWRRSGLRRQQGQA
jgi:peptidoglycan/xylan/chitin deacetylase (PgdA/CDA1 family)